MDIGALIRTVRVRLTDEYRRPALFRREGAQIGEGWRLLVTSLVSEPYLATIGYGSFVAGGVLFLTHDAGTRIFRRQFPEATRFGRITVGSRVVDRANAILLPGVTLGDGSIVGAGAVVTRDVPAGDSNLHEPRPAPGRPKRTLSQSLLLHYPPRR